MVNLGELLKNPLFILGIIIAGCLLLTPVPGDELVGLIPVILAILTQGKGTTKKKAASKKSGGEK